MVSIHNKEYRTRHPERKIKSDNNWIKNNRAKSNAIKRRWDINNRKKSNAIKRAWFKNHVKTNQKFRISLTIRHNLYDALKRHTQGGKVKPSKKYGIDYPKIMEHLMSTLPSDFKEKKYHIDHIKPCCAFDLENPEEVKKCFDVSNLQWLSKEDNLHKISQDRKQSIHK